MNSPETKHRAAAGSMEPVGKEALIASVGGQRGWADWTNPDHRLRRLLAEFLGMAGLTSILSGARPSWPGTAAGPCSPGRPCWCCLPRRCGWRWRSRAGSSGWIVVTRRKVASPVGSAAGRGGP